MNVSIIDDDESVRMAIGGLVRSIGLQASLFDSAEAFLAQNPPSVCIVTDIQMPGMSGIELQDALVMRGHRVPLIVVTAFPEEAIRERALAAGAAYFLCKPFDGSELIGCIERVVRDARLRS